MMQIKGLRIIFITLIVFILSGCGDQGETNNNNQESQNLLENPYQKTEIIMGTAITMRIYDEGKEDLLEESFELLRGFEDLVSVNIEGSEIDQINDNAG